MPDKKKISELQSVVLGNSDYFAVAHDNSGVRESGKVSTVEIGQKVNGGIEYSGIHKEIIAHQNPIAAINELQNYILDSVLPSDTVSDSIASFPDGADDVSVKDFKTTIVPIQASGTPSPSNPLPITGRTQIVATQGGPNLYDYTTDTTNKYYKSNGTQEASTSWRCSDYIEVTPSSKVIATGLDSGSTSGAHYLCLYKQDKSFSRSIQIYANTDVVVSVASDEYYIRTSVCKASNEYLTAKVFKVVDEKTISLGTSVYGGELDILNGGGKIQYGIVTLDGSETWQAYNSGNGFSIEISDMKTGSYMNGWSNMFTASSDSSEMHIILGSSNANKRVYFSQVKSIEGVNDAASWKTWLSNNNVQLVYPLETEVDLTTQAEAFNTREGENQFYTDSGDSTVEYRADIQLYIDKKTANNRSLGLMMNPMSQPEETREEETVQEESDNDSNER